jgi:hypothetical protein
MPRKRELINLQISNSTNSNFTIPLFQRGVSSINATTKYTWDITGGDLSCLQSDIIINGVKYYVSFDGTASGLADAFTNLGFGFFSYEISGGNTYIYTVDDTNVYSDVNLCNTTTTSTTTTTTTTTSTTTTAAPTSVTLNWSILRSVGGGNADLIVTDVFSNVLLSVTSTAVLQSGTLTILNSVLPYTITVNATGVAGANYVICNISAGGTLDSGFVPNGGSANYLVSPTPLVVSTNVIYGGVPAVCPP